jgi:AraC-like DNA-binding protein
LIGIAIAEKDFRREVSTILQRQPSVRLGATRRIDISGGSSRVFLDAMHMLQADLDQDQEPRNNKAIRLMFDRLIVYSLLHLLGGDSRGQPAGRKDSLAPRHIRRAEEYIKAHLSEPLDNELLARVAQVSPRSLYRSFVHFRGVTPFRYVQELRLEQAHRLLTAADRAGDIRSIAAQAGFPSYASFWRSYVRKFGAPPSKSRGRNGLGEDSSRS